MDGSRAARAIWWHLKSIVFGGLDGILTSFAIVLARMGPSSAQSQCWRWVYPMCWQMRSRWAQAIPVIALVAFPYVTKEREREARASNYPAGGIAEMVSSPSLEDVAKTRRL